MDQSLHLFINHSEKDIPAKLIRMSSILIGNHEITHLVVGDNKTVYIAGGAIVRAVIGPVRGNTASVVPPDCATTLHQQLN